MSANRCDNLCPRDSSLKLKTTKQTNIADTTDSIQYNKPISLMGTLLRLTVQVSF